MTVHNIRQKEFNDLYNSHDLLPFFRIKSFWAKIKLVFFTVDYDNQITFITPKSNSVISRIKKWTEGLFPV